MRFILFVIMLLLIVDGGWFEWVEFGFCDVFKCGNGIKTFKRICSNFELENGG